MKHTTTEFVRLQILAFFMNWEKRKFGFTNILWQRDIKHFFY